jgi:hypothetical protein
MTIVNCFQKCGFNLNQTNDREDVRELSIAENDWGKQVYHFKNMYPVMICCKVCGADLRTNDG